MSARRRKPLGDRLRMVHLAARTIGGRRYWLAPLLLLLWPGFWIVMLLIGWRQSDFAPADAQGWLIGIPLVILGVGFGVRVIAGEIDRRTLEIAYTVPGGTARVWTSKLVAALVLLLAGEALLAGASFLFFTPFPPGALYGAFQAAVFYMVLAMGLSTLFKSEATGALVTFGVLTLNGFLTGFGGFQGRLSPFFNPEVLQTFDPANVLAWTVQNRIAMVLIAGAITLLAFARAERREKMLSG